MKYFGRRAAIFLILFNLFATVGRAQSLPPFPTDPYLDSWSFFDPTNWYSDMGDTPIGFTNIVCDQSAWSSDDGVLDCNGLILDSPDPAYLTYKTVQSPGNTNLICSAGTVWFWFSSDWDSMSAGTGGSGPGNWGEFIDTGAWTSNAAFGYWGLSVDPDGDNLYFSGQTNGAGTNYLSYPISWTAGSWHLIGLTYTPTNSILYVDGQFATNGIGVLYPPSEYVLTNSGFNIGSDYSGVEQARGEFVDVETWANQYSADYFSNYYAQMLPEIGGVGFGGFGDAFGGVGGFIGTGGSSSGAPAFVDGTNLWLQITGTTNTGTSMTAYFTIWPPNGVTNGVYDLYYTTNLDSDVPGLNLTNWAWILRCGAGQTNLTVTNLTASYCFFQLGLTNDTDGDGMSDAFETLVSHTDPNNGDQNSNGIPDGWEWNYFGNLNQAATNDYDGDGHTILYDYTNGIDPNIIRFSLMVNNYVNTTNPSVPLYIAGGVPGYYAVLVNDTNLADANWQPYTSSNIIVTLGSTDGLYNVQVGLQGLATNATQTWQPAEFTLDTVPPVLTITNPATSTVSVPMIQLQGFADESLGSLTYDVSNATGIVTNQQGYWQAVFYDTNSLTFTTNIFQCYDIVLTNGVNTITVHAADLAGNVTTTNVSFTLDYSGDTNPPALALVWPQNNTPIGGNGFTLKAQVANPTVTVTVSIVDTNADTNTVSGLVERSGQTWVGLPLGGGTNAVTVTAMDAAGNTTVTNLNVVGNNAGLTITPLTDDQMNQSNVTVSGSVGSTNDSVTVNGVAATVNSDGTWTASNVPVNPNDTASIQAQVYDSSFNLVTSQVWDQQQPETVALSSYTGFHYSYAYSSGGGYGSYISPWTEETKDLTWWTLQGGGNDVGHDIYSGAAYPYEPSYDDEWDDALSAGEGGFQPDYYAEALLDVGVWENSDVSPNYAIGAGFGRETGTDKTQTRVAIQPRGQQAAGTMVNYIVRAQVWDKTSGQQLPPSATQIQGMALTPLTNSSSEIWGYAGITAPANAMPDVTPTAAGSYTFNVETVKTKEDWQQEVRTEIQLGNEGVDIQYYHAANGFSQNIPYISAVYAFYQMVYLEQPTEYYWAGLAKLAGAPVFAGLHDAQIASPVATDFQNKLIGMNIAILNDLAWQFEAYRKGGVDALEEVYAVDVNLTNLDLNAITAWRNIDQGIQQNNQTLILEGNEALLQREQQQILPPGYSQLSFLDTALMSIFAKCPVWDSDPTQTDYDEPFNLGSFNAVMTSLGYSSFNIANTDNRWTWITAPTTGIWDTWVNLSLSDKTNQVSVPLITRAATYY